MKRFDWQDGGDACEHTDGDWVRYDDARAVIDGLQADAIADLEERSREALK